MRVNHPQAGFIPEVNESRSRYVYITPSIRNPRGSRNRQSFDENFTHVESPNLIPKIFPFTLMPTEARGWYRRWESPSGFTPFKTSSTQIARVRTGYHNNSSEIS